MLSALFVAAAAALSARLADAHIVPWSMGMYCLNGTSGSMNLNADEPVLPVYQMKFSDWWMHAFDGCTNFPPADGDFLELPAGGVLTIEMASNKGKTSLSFDGQYTTDWPDGAWHPDDYNDPNCITSPNLHTQNESMASGSAFAISYVSELSQVTPENLVVFTVKERTPWKRIANFDIPAAMPACPEGGCICAWGWIPNGCGIPNMYMMPYKCKVTGATGTVAVGTPKPPVWCEENPSQCVTGPKQMLFWEQEEGNNIWVDGYDLSGGHKYPGYNPKCGFANGAQNDIFTGGAAQYSSDSSSTSSGNAKGVEIEDPATPSQAPVTTDAVAAVVAQPNTPTSTSTPAPVYEEPATTQETSSTSSLAPANTDISKCRKRRSLKKKADEPTPLTKRAHRRLAGHSH